MGGIALLQCLPHNPVPCSPELISPSTSTGPSYLRRVVQHVPGTFLLKRGPPKCQRYGAPHGPRGTSLRASSGQSLHGSGRVIMTIPSHHSTLQGPVRILKQQLLCVTDVQQGRYHVVHEIPQSV